MYPVVIVCVCNYRINRVSDASSAPPKYPLHLTLFTFCLFANLLNYDSVWFAFVGSDEEHEEIFSGDSSARILLWRFPFSSCMSIVSQVEVSTGSVRMILWYIIRRMNLWHDHLSMHTNAIYKFVIYLRYLYDLIVHALPVFSTLSPCFRLNWASIAGCARRASLCLASKHYQRTHYQRSL